MLPNQEKINIFYKTSQAVDLRYYYGFPES